MCAARCRVREIQTNLHGGSLMRPGKPKVCIPLLPGALCVALCLAATGPAQAWTHPGIVASQAQLDATRSAYQAGNSVIVDQVNKAKNSNYGSLSYSVKGPWPGGINQCGSNSNPNNGCQQADDDSNAAYVQALLWYMTGNRAYADNAIDIMNTYAAGFRGYAGTNGLSCPSGTDVPTGRCNPGGTRRSGRAPRKSSATAGPAVAPAPAGARRASRLSPTC
jgi:hypothetical protein